MIPMASKMPPLDSLAQNDQNEVRHDFSVMWCLCHWHQFQLTTIFSGITTFLKSRHLTWCVTWHFWWCDTIDTGFTWLQWQKCWCHVMSFKLVLESHDSDMSSMAPLYSLDQDDWNEVQHYVFDHVTLVTALSSCDTDGIVNDTIPFCRSWQLEWDAVWLLSHVTL